jgi:hypothetical protein
MKAHVKKDSDHVRLEFVPITGVEHRWTPEGLRKHVIEWVMANGPRFVAHRGEIKARRKPYRQKSIDWLHPPSLEA